jgi:hypothetical protein
MTAGLTSRRPYAVLDEYRPKNKVAWLNTATIINFKSATLLRSILYFASVIYISDDDRGPSSTVRYPLLAIGLIAR